MLCLHKTQYTFILIKCNMTLGKVSPSRGCTNLSDIVRIGEPRHVKFQHAMFGGSIAEYS